MKYLTFIRHRRPPATREREDHLTDGPFSESKEVIGGWAILKVASKSEAIRLATEFMELHRKHWPGFEGEAEVRPMFEPGTGAGVD